MTTWILWTWSNFLILMGVPCPVACGAMSFQMLPKIRFTTLGHLIIITDRTRGSLPGTRTAVRLSQIPVKDALFFDRQKFADLAFEIDRSNFSAMTFVDNIYMPANDDGRTGVSAMRHVESDLQRRWHLNFGKDTKSVLQARYNLDPTTEEHLQELEAACAEYPEKQVTKTLGCFIDNSGSLTADFEDMEEKIWRTYFANAGSIRGQGLSENSGIRMTDRVCRSIVAHRTVRRPFQAALAKRLDRLQSAIYAAIQCRPRQPWESPAKFAQERGKKAAKASRDIGL